MDPFSKLPSETLSEIFVHCLPPESEPISSKNGPLLLTQVSHRWREVAFGTPALWQIIHMDREWKQKPIFMLDLFLNKSRNLPVIITLPLSTEKATERKEAFANRLLDDFHRVLSLKGHTPPLFSYFLLNRLSALGTPSHIYAPMLRSLNLSSLDVPANLPPKEAQKLLQNYIIAPNLEEFHVHGNRMMLSMVRFSPETLKVLTGLHMNIATAISDLILLSRATELVTVDICFFIGHYDPTSRFLSSICLPKLKHLKIYSHGIGFENFIRSLYCPAIEELYIQLVFDALFSNFVEALTKGQSSSLRCILLRDCPGTRLSTLCGFKEVKELILFRFMLDEIDAQALIEKDGSEFRLLPQLSSFVLQDIVSTGPTVIDSLFSAFRARCATSGGTLSYVRFEVCSRYEKIIRDLRNEMEGKLTIDIIDDDDEEDEDGLEFTSSLGGFLA